MLAREFRTASSTVLRRYHDRRFRALFGVSVDICVALWLHIQSHIVGNAIRPKHLLWALHFMKENPTEISGSSKWGVDPGTWSQHVQRVLRLLHRWLPALPWSLRNTGAINGVLTGIVDVTRVKIEKPALHPWEYYSKYDNFHALKFEVVVSAMKPHLIIWICVSNRSKYHVPAELWADAVVGLGLVRRRLRVSEGTSRPVTGSKPLAKNSVHAYGKHIRGLRYYCCLVGDYDSLLVLQDDAPSDHCPSMSAKTLSNFVRFKKGVKRTPLVDASGVPVPVSVIDERACALGHIVLAVRHRRLDGEKKFNLLHDKRRPLDAPLEPNKVR
ncbi:unnamed protein product (mitochondrion) [Plasmodiophora brassicae]|uniref:Uncharacterized protein n=1 Tax=Plasmodiophora brassicae TaxID=37360 RepID=A0A3P3YH89_PLABS|nr:unnamed protein product [Plasmodiophora brassicae]